MSRKLKIALELGERALLVPELVARALDANERVKVLFTLLQAARDRAERPELPPADLGVELSRAGLGETGLGEAVDGSRAAGASYRVPHARRIVDLALEGVGEMLAPLRDGRALDEARLDELAARLERERERCTAVEGEVVPRALVSELTRADRGAGDSLHLLVMDLHKELNRLQRSLAEERLDGAHVYGLEEEDRAAVRAFMSGLNRTAPLKFDHPGLDCTATRSGRRLVIQNDIGTTDAHVLVIHVEGLEVEVIYTDVHARRARFLRERLAGFPLEWSESLTRADASFEDGGYRLERGLLRARDRGEVERFLAHLGSRLVFLIDWNKARKRLQRFVDRKEAVALLGRAADEEFGHRAFLELGGEKLVFDAIENAAQAHVPYGQRLDEVLGRAQTAAFLELVLRRCASGLVAGQSEGLIRDEVRAELANSFRSVRDDLLALAADHAALVFELASGLSDALASTPAPEPARRNARRARDWEQRADRLLTRTREMLERSTPPGNEVYRVVLERSDDAADGLEEAAFLATLFAEVQIEGELLAALRRLARLVADGTQEYVKCVETAALVHRGGARELVQDFLGSVARLVAAEHETDDAEREVTAALVRAGDDARRVHLVSRYAAALEESIDALCRAGFLLRDHVLSQVILG